MEVLIEFLPALMFVALILGMFTGLPVAMVIGGTAVLFGAIAHHPGRNAPGTGLAFAKPDLRRVH